jgi:hypothetical protein
MAIFSAYFDASGNKRKDAMAFAGFVSTVDKWDRFAKEWTAILSSYHVKSLHMTGFASSREGFESWKGKTKSRRKFISALVGCIKRNTHKGFSSGLYIEDYRQINGQFSLAESIGQPYPFCGFTCLGGLKRWALKKRINLDEMLVLVEDGDEDQERLLTIARTEGFHIERASKAAAVAFQAADLVGWKTRTALQDALRIRPKTDDEAEKILSSLDPLEGAVQNMGGYDKQPKIVGRNV